MNSFSKSPRPDDQANVQDLFPGDREKYFYTIVSVVGLIPFYFCVRSTFKPFHIEKLKMENVKKMETGGENEMRRFSGEVDAEKKVQGKAKFNLLFLIKAIPRAFCDQIIWCVTLVLYFPWYCWDVMHDIGCFFPWKADHLNRAQGKPFSTAFEDGCESLYLDITWRGRKFVKFLSGISPFLARFVFY